MSKTPFLRHHYNTAEKWLFSPIGIEIVIPSQTGVQHLPAGEVEHFVPKTLKALLSVSVPIPLPICYHKSTGIKKH